MIKFLAFGLTWLGMALLYVRSPNQRLRSVPAPRRVLWLACLLLLAALALWVWAEGAGAGVSGWVVSGMLGMLLMPVLALIPGKGAA